MNLVFLVPMFPIYIESQNRNYMPLPPNTGIGTMGALMSVPKPAMTPMGSSTLSMGTKATSPSGAANTGQNKLPPKFTAPTSQQTGSGQVIPTPVNVSSFNPAQMSAFNAANKLGTGVQTYGTPQPASSGGTMTALMTGGNQTPTNTQPTNTPPPNPNQNPYTPALAQNSFIGSPTAGAAASGLMQAPSQNQALGQKAQDIENYYQSQIAGLLPSYNEAIGQASTGTAPVGLGGQALTYNSVSNRLGNLQASESAALQGINQQLTAQSQGQQGLTSAGQLGISGQQLLQSGLTSAAQLGQPSGNYPFVFNPNTGTFTNASTGGVATPTDLAGEVLSGKIPYSQAVSALGYMGGTGEAQLQSAILAQNPQANISQLQAQVAGSQAGTQAVAAAPGTGTAAGTAAVAAAGGQAAAKNISTAITTPTGSYSDIFGTANQNMANFAGAQSNINNLGNSIMSFMSSDPNINSLGARALNMKLNQVSTQFNSPQYANFNSQIAGLQRAISNYLQQGEIPSASTANAQSIVDGSISLGALAGALQGINSDLTAAYSAQKTVRDNAQSNMQSGASSSSGLTSNGAFSDKTFYGQ